MRSAADSEARRTSGPNKARLAEEENWTKLDYFDAEVRHSFVFVDLSFVYYYLFLLGSVYLCMFFFHLSM